MVAFWGLHIGTDKSAFVVMAVTSDSRVGAYLQGTNTGRTQMTKIFHTLFLGTGLVTIVAIPLSALALRVLAN
jgi:hypothetical protein